MHELQWWTKMIYNFWTSLLTFYSLLPEPNMLIWKIWKEETLWFGKTQQKIDEHKCGICHSSEYDNDGIIRQNNNVTVSYDEGTLLLQKI